MSAAPSEQVKEYLTRLTGHDFQLSDAVSLSSGQRARFQAWSEAHAIALNEDLLASGAFRVSEVVLDAPATRASAPSMAADVRVPAPAHALPTAIGIDIQRIDEIVPDVPDLRSEPELQALFTPREFSYAETRPHPRDTLAGLFAAKEAILKTGPAQPTDRFATLEILPDAAGQPRCAGFALSISHSGDYAIAVAARLPSAPVASEPAAVENGHAHAPSAPAPAPASHAKPSRRGGVLRRLVGGLYRLVLFAGAVCFILLVIDRLTGSRLLA